MPSREFISVRGYSPRIGMEMLDSLRDDTWFAIPDAIRDDPLAVAVHVGVLAVRGRELLIDQEGRLLRSAPVAPEAFEGAVALVALRRCAEARAKESLGLSGRAELCGYVHDPVRFPRLVVLVYKVQAAADLPAPSGAWLAPSAAADLVREPLDATVLAGLP